MAGGAPLNQQQAIQNLGQLFAQQGQMGSGAGAPPSFMQYAPQGQPNQPPPTLSSDLSSTQYMGGPDQTGNNGITDMGFDKSGNDGGVGGQPTQMQNPLAQGNKPLNMSQFSQQQGLQIQGNPTSQVVQRPQR